MRDRRVLKMTVTAALVTAALGLWHFIDVRTGAVATGDAWLTRGYLVLWAAAVGGVIVCGWMLYGTWKGRGLSLERIYPAAGLFLGLLYLMVLPPLSAPDEVSHYVTAYELSSRLLGQPSRREDGCVLVRARDWFLEDVYGNFEIAFEEGYWAKSGELPTGQAPDGAVALGRELNESTYRTIHDVWTGASGTYQEQWLASGLWRDTEAGTSGEPLADLGASRAGTRGEPQTDQGASRAGNAGNPLVPPGASQTENLTDGSETDGTAAARTDRAETDGMAAARMDGSETDGMAAARTGGSETDGMAAARTGGSETDGTAAARTDGSGTDSSGLMVVTSYPPVTTTPAAYLPQAVGIAAARLLGLDSLWLVYIGRLCNLVFFVAATWLAMKRLPFGKELLFGVALLPMTLHLSASFSYDVMILACVFLLTAVCLDLAFARDRVRVRDVALIAVLAAVAGPCKMIYAPMFGLCLLVPVKKFGGWKRWAAAALAVAVSYGAAMLLVNGSVVARYAAMSAETAVTSNGESGISLSLLLHRPGLLLSMFYNTLVYQLDEFHLTMIGAQLGNLDPVLGVPYLVVLLDTAGLLLLALRVPGEELRLTGGRRIWVFTLCAACAAAALLSMLIACTPRGSLVIEGVQGRYFLPFLPVLLMACKNDRFVLTKDGKRSILYLMFCANAYALCRLYSLVCLRV